MSARPASRDRPFHAGCRRSSVRTVAPSGVGFIYKAVVSIAVYIFVVLSYSRFDVGRAFDRTSSLVGVSLSILILVGLSILKRTRILNVVTIPALGWICFLFLNYLYLSTDQQQGLTWRSDYLFATFLMIFVPSFLALSSAAVLFRRDPATN